MTPGRAVLRRLPDERSSINHQFQVGKIDGVLIVGLYEDGTPGEIFIVTEKEGSTFSGLLRAFATSISWNLQFGVPLKFLVDDFTGTRFEPSGWTGKAEIPYAQSILDYIFRWLGQRFLGETEDEKKDTNQLNLPLEEAPAVCCGRCGAKENLLPDGAGGLACPNHEPQPPSALPHIEN